ncbi:outer membrane beta-barrel protein [Pedobacter sp. L105]|uniref:outer membrane beta-barrel protein n=1 Tax=Pedobacter sp. L105 TaxID=1641871 RepID=UPI00131DC728|nr:outer membrane beta-barrel protein [Pedobacter sp. L105]
MKKTGKTIHFIIALILIIFGVNSLTQAQAKQDSIVKQDSTRRLKEVAVTGRKTIIKQKSDRIIYDLQADPESKGNSVLGMMHKIPYIAVDPSGNILLKGNSSYKVLINGKPSGVAQSNLTDLLRTMPASTIQRIEVITVPPSKYDAEGLAGIINIITNKKENNGYSGTLNVNGQFPAAGPGVGGSFSMKQGKFGLSAFGGAGYNHAPETSNSANRTSTGVSSGSLTQEGNTKSNSRNGYFGAELSYEIDSLHLVSSQLNWYGNHNKGFGSQYFKLEGTQDQLQSYQLNNQTVGSRSGVDASLNYQLGFKADKNRLLTFSYLYSENNNNLSANVNVINPVNFLTPDYRQDNDEHSPEHTLQVDFLYPLKNLTIESGIKGIFRAQKSDFQYLSLNGSNNEFELQPINSDSYNYTQQVLSAYNSYILNLKSWSFQAGIRAEETLVEADYLSTVSKVKRNYLRVVPNLSLNKNFTNGDSWSFGFSQRIKRPGINRLNPFVNRLNPNFETTGNPNLQPELVNDLQSAYTFSGKTAVTIGLDYAFLNNSALAVATFNPLTQITRTTYENTGKITGLSNFINISRQLTKRWNVSFNGSMIYFWLEGEAEGVFVKKELLNYTINLSTGYEFDKGWRLNAGLDVQSHNPTGFQGSTNGRVGSSIGFSKELIQHRLSVAALVNNPFVKYWYSKTYTTGNDFYQRSSVQSYYNSYRLSLNYNFGSLKEKIRKNKNGINNNDVSN